MSVLTETTTCEVCGASGLGTVLDLGSHPLCDDLIPVESTRQSETYPIEILFCDTCRTAHQRYQVKKEQLFPDSYHYRSRFTADVLSGMQALVEAVEAEAGSLERRKVLDIGCNDGSLLNFFAKRGAVTVGVEPTLASKDALARGHQVEHAYFDQETASRLQSQHQGFDVITFTNVFAHIEDLQSLLAAVEQVMHEDTLLVIENHYLGAVLDRHQFDTFYHEHPRTYSLKSFQYIAASLDKCVRSVSFPSRYGGNIRVMIGAQPQADSIDGELLAQVATCEEGFVEEFTNLRKFVSTWQQEKSAELAQLVDRYGPLTAKAFPGRAAILVRCLDLDESTVRVVHEKPGSMKIGHYLPGTRIPIQSDDELFAEQPPPEVILNLAWHISREIREYLTANNCTARMIDILDA